MFKEQLTAFRGRETSPRLSDLKPELTRFITVTKGMDDAIGEKDKEGVIVADTVNHGGATTPFTSTCYNCGPYWWAQERVSLLGLTMS